MQKSLIEVMSHYQHHINHIWWRFDCVMIKQYKQKQELLFLQGKENTHKPQLLLEQFTSYYNEDKTVSYKIVILDFSKYDNKPNIQIVN